MSKALIKDNIEDAPKEVQLQDAQKVIAGSVPLMPEAPDTVVYLPRGLYIGGKWETVVQVRELTGGDEESLARFKNPEDFFSAVVSYGTERIGDQDLTELKFAERQALLADLLIGEREILFLNIARVTYGDEKIITHQCPACGVSMDTSVILSEDIKCREMEDPHVVSRTMTTSKGHVLTYRLATGADQKVVLSKKGASTAEQNTLMISECVYQVDGKPVVDPLSMARGLSMGDRMRLLDKLVSTQPNPDLNLTTNCVSCSSEMVVPLSWGDIFRP